MTKKISLAIFALTVFLSFGGNILAETEKVDIAAEELSVDQIINVLLQRIGLPFKLVHCLQVELHELWKFVDILLFETRKLRFSVFKF